MQVKVFAGLFLLITSVLAGGYAGAIERVWLFYAYQIDGLNPQADQTIGYKCMSWDREAKKCRSKGKKNGWAMCKGRVGENKRCSMAKLLNQIGRVSENDPFAASSDGKPLPLETTDPDPQKTAQNLYKQLSAGSVFGPAGVKDWQPYRILKDGTADYADAVERVSDVVAKTSAKLRAEADGKALDPATEKLFTRFEECNRLIKTARIGDHGRFLIDAAEKYLKPRGIDVKIEILDPPVNPVDSTRNWSTVDWEATVDEAVKAGKGTKEQLEDLMKEAKRDFYGPPADGSKPSPDQAKAEEHRAVIEAYTNAHNKAAGCLLNPPARE